MTSNQIANATNIENQRHNRVMEDISAQSNQLAAEKNQITKEYNENSLRIQEQYNNVSLQIQEAQGQRKLDLQEQLNWIEFQKANVDANYKASMAELNARDTRTRELNQQELAKYQQSLVQLGYDKNEIESQLASIKAKQAEYEKYNIENQVRIQDFMALANKQKVEYDYSLGLIRAENEQVRNELQKELQEWQEATMFTDSVWKGVGTFLRALGGK